MYVCRRPQKRGNPSQTQWLHPKFTQIAEINENNCFEEVCAANGVILKFGQLGWENPQKKPQALHYWDRLINFWTKKTWFLNILTHGDHWPQSPHKHMLISKFDSPVQKFQHPCPKISKSLSKNLSFVQSFQNPCAKVSLALSIDFEMPVQKFVFKLSKSLCRCFFSPVDKLRNTYPQVSESLSTHCNLHDDFIKCESFPHAPPVPLPECFLGHQHFLGNPFRLKELKRVEKSSNLNLQNSQQNESKRILTWVFWSVRGTEVHFLWMIIVFAHG